MDAVLTKLADYAGAMRARPLTAEESAAGVLRVIDTVGCAIAASKKPFISTIASAVLELGGTGSCTIFDGTTAPVDRAVFINGFMARYLDFNDTYQSKEISHPSDLIPAALALGELYHRSGDSILRAIAAGYGVLCSFCDAVSTYDRGWDLGFAAASAAVESAMLLELDHEKTANAISLAVVPQVALVQTRLGELSAWKGAAFPNAVRNAVFAAHLAKAGMGGPDQAFEGKRGVIAQITGPIELALDPNRTRLTETDIKMFPLAIGCQGPTELALELRAKLGIFGPGDGKAVRAAITGISVVGLQRAMRSFADSPAKWAPKTHETADHSIPFLVAAALVYGTLTSSDIERGLHDDDVMYLTSLVKTSVDESYTARYPAETPVAITISGPSGDISGTLDLPTGSVNRPFSAADVSRKFHANADPVIGREKATALENRLQRLATTPDVAGILTLS